MWHCLRAGNINASHKFPPPFPKTDTCPYKARIQVYTLSWT